MKLRIKFAKYGALKFIGHLDVMRFFQKAVRRADIDIAYTGGMTDENNIYGNSGFCSAAVTCTGGSRI